MDIQYHEVIPTNDRGNEGYTSYNNIDYMITVPEGRALVLKNIRFEGQLVVKSDASTVSTNTSCYLDADVGAHGLIGTITTELDASGVGIVAENLNEYSRFVKHMNIATKKSVMDNNNLSEVVQLKAPDYLLTNHYLLANSSLEGGHMDFSLPLMMMLNRPDDPTRVALSGSKVGAIKLSVILARFENAIFGNDLNSDYLFEIKNPRFVYQTVLDDAEYKQPIVFRSYVPVKQSISSSQSSVYNKVPAVCRSVSINYQQQSKELELGENNNHLERVEVSELSFLFNNSSNSLLTYVLRNESEIIAEAVDAVADTGKDSLTMNKIHSGNYIQGCNFDEELDLSNTGFTVNMVSGIQSSNPLNMYMYFHSLIKM